MQAVDEIVLNRVNSWLMEKKQCWLATVVETWGSSPRPIGSLFACDETGQMEGSLSGGCVEEDLLEKLVNGELAKTEIQEFMYGVTSEEAEKFGLPCGGTLNTIIEPLQPNQKTINHFQDLIARVNNRRNIRRTVNVALGTYACEATEDREPLSWNAEDKVLRQTYGPQFQLFIIGAGMVSKYLSEMALMLDYEVTICDPREEFIKEFDIEGVHLINDMPDDAVKRQANDPATAIVALTHDPRIDDMGLMEALKTEAFYIGAMGSSRTSASRRERLTQLDLTKDHISRLHAPIGLPIGSKTPPEIAIAILAEITAVRKNPNEAMPLASLENL
ncbi:MAG: hypothetical protein CMD74_01960 [Gammaproteobacteria bacterium]|nr:hypothetical protein [Gammaproteobacteria bacterium]